MIAKPGGAVCRVCGVAVDPLRAPRVRFTARERFYFCSEEHALAFRIVPALPLEAPEVVLPEETAVPAPATSSVLPSNEARRSEPPLAPTGTPRSFSPLPPARIIAPPPPNLTLTLAAALAPILLCLTGAALLGATGGDPWPAASAATVLAATAYFSLRAVSSWLTQTQADSAAYLPGLSESARRITDGEPYLLGSNELRPGEEIVVLAGEHVPSDGTVAEGRAEVTPWLNAQRRITLKAGARVCAGARLNEGALTIICTKTGAERAYASLLPDALTQTASQVFPSRWARLASDSLGPGLGLLCGALSLLLYDSLPQALVVAGVAWGTISSPLSRRLPEFIYKTWLLKLGAHGVTFSHHRLVDDASSVTTAVFCARGTLLHGEPEVSEIHPLRGTTEDEVLALCAGAESVIHHPVAAAVLRAAETRKIPSDTCRSHHSAPGMGVLCTSQAGDQIVLGSRELLLKERISIAMAEETLRQLESRGLTAIMLAKNDHLIGVLALLDSLRPGAKASIQLLVDEGIEPIVLSGDSRKTTEAVARALSMEHVRPEVSTSERAKEIENLSEAGSVLAVIGTTPRDDPALGAAPVPLVLDGASVSWKEPGSSYERGCSLATSFLPGLVGALAMAFDLAPLFLPPLVSALGVAVAGHLASRSARESGRLLWQ